MYKKLILASTLAFAKLLVPSVANADTIKIASADYCPKMCPSSDKHDGYITDLVNEVFRDSKYDVEIKIYPWTRAVSMVESGAAHALLIPTKGEAPNLAYPTQEIGVQKMCFFTRSNSTWVYDGLGSLGGMKVGIFQGGDFGELNDHIGSNNKQFQSLAWDDQYASKSMKKMDIGRMDAFISGYGSVQYEITQRGIADQYRVAGCVLSDNLYLGFTPDSNQKMQVEAMMAHYDKRMIEIRRSGIFSRIMSKYGLDENQSDDTLANSE